MESRKRRTPKVPRLEDMAGGLSKYASVKEMKRSLDRARDVED